MYVACSYPYGGNVPLNLARLFASVAHYCPRQDDYNAKVMCASGHEEVAHLVRTITEETHRQTEVYMVSYCEENPGMAISGASVYNSSWWVLNLSENCLLRILVACIGDATNITVAVLHCTWIQYKRFIV